MRHDLLVESLAWNAAVESAEEMVHQAGVFILGQTIRKNRPQLAHDGTQGRFLTLERRAPLFVLVSSHVIRFLPHCLDGIEAARAPGRGSPSPRPESPCILPGSVARADLDPP